MKKYFFITIVCAFISTINLAQSKDEKKYAERAAEIQLEVWDGVDKAFEVTQVSEKFKNSSAVIIAKSVEVTNSTKRKFKMTTIFGGSVKQFKYFTTYRERVLINSKLALDDFSTISYNKKTDKTGLEDASNYKDIVKTYVGVKVFKKNGEVININPDDEEVVTKNTKREKEGKLAVPNLQIGDILDYYIRIEELKEFDVDVKGPDVYFLGGEYPIMYYNVKYILDKKCGADIISLNGAKPFEDKINEDDDILIEFTEKDLPAYNSSTLWANQFRQLPYHVVRYGFSGADIIAKKGEVKKGPFTDVLMNNTTDFFKEIIGYNKGFYPKFWIEKIYGGKKNILNIPVDSFVNYVYDFYRWGIYGEFSETNVSNKRNADNMVWFKSAISFCELLRGYNIKGDIIVVCNKNAGRIGDSFYTGDFEIFVRINNNDSIRWFCFNSFFEDIGKISKDYQGEDALLYTRELKGIGTPFITDGKTFKLPISKSNENVLAEKLNVKFNTDNLQIITIERTSTETGAMKQNDQKKLLLAEDVQEKFSQLVRQKKYVDSLASKKKTADIAPLVQKALDKERLKQKGYFEDEIKAQYGQPAKELTSYKILNDGLSQYAPQFIFSQTFTMENFVKKAGNNFIFEVGKLMGDYKKLNDEERKRTLDVYMPSARTLSYSFAIAIPEGYTVKGVEELNKKVENDIASFASTASSNGNTVNITITRIYNNNFEPAVNWPKLLNVMDAAADFTNLKLLLEKKK